MYVYIYITLISAYQPTEPVQKLRTSRGDVGPNMVSGPLMSLHRDRENDDEPIDLGHPIVRQI